MQGTLPRVVRCCRTGLLATTAAEILDWLISEAPAQEGRARSGNIAS